MKGCLLWPLRLALTLLFLLALAGGWLYRRELAGMWRFWQGGAPVEAPVTGRATARGLASASDKVDSLNGWRADSIILDAEELASIIEAGLGGAAARYLDSVSVTLGTCLLYTSPSPRDA